MRKRTMETCCIRPLLASFALLLLTMGCRLPLPEAAATAIGARGRGAEIVVVGQDRNLYLTDASGEDWRAITEDARLPTGEDDGLRTYGNPTWAPTTGHLAYTELAGSPGGLGRAAILLRRAGTDSAEILYDDPNEVPFYLYWSPSGEALTFLTSGQGEGLGLWLVEIGGEPTQLDSGQPYYWTWAPDSSKLLSHVGGSAAQNPEGAGLRIIDARTGRVTDLDLEPQAFQAPAYHPAGERVLVSVADRQAARGLATLSPAGTFQSALLPSTRPMVFSWSPTGDQLALLEAPPAGQPIFGELSLLKFGPEGNVDRVEPDLPPVSGFFWSPSGEHLAVFVPDFEPPAAEQQVSLGRQEGEELLIRLYLLEADTAQAELLSTLRPTQAFLQVLPFFDQYAQSATIWSPDGGEIVFTSRRPGGDPGVFVVAAQPDAERNLIGVGELAFWSFQGVED